MKNLRIRLKSPLKKITRLFDRLSVSSIKKKLRNTLSFLKTAKFYLLSFGGRKILSENTHWYFIGLYIFFLTVYLLCPTITPDISKSNEQSIANVTKLIGFPGFSDATVKYIILTTTKSLGLILSFLSAIYVFTHREQKSISPSMSNGTRKNSLVLIVLGVVFGSMLIGHTLASNFDVIMHQDNYSSQYNLYASTTLFYKILIWIVAIVLTIRFTTSLIKYLFFSMSVDKMLRHSIEETSDNIDFLIEFYNKPYFEKLLTARYRNLHHHIESIFQNLKFIGDNNMNKEFEENVASFSNVVSKLKRDNPKYNINNVSSYLLEKDKEHFQNIYTSLLRNTLSLTIDLYKNHHFNKGKKLTFLYFSLYLGSEESLRQHFILSLNEFLDSLDTSNERQLRDFLNGLKRLPEEQSLIIYKNLISKLILKKNVEVLTNVVYDFKEHIIDNNNQPLPSNMLARVIAMEKKNKLKSNAILILLQCLTKTIEISQYNITGFLIKYLVTNFTGDELNSAYDTLRKTPKAFTTIFEQNKDYILQYNDNFDIGLGGLNDGTFDYCCKKMCILIYGQQQYAISQKLWFVKDSPQFHTPFVLATEFESCTYSNYVFQKVKSASSSYGLLFFEDTTIMNDIKQKMSLQTTTA
ncbi:hypothetical protein [Priestia megaterium]|uniref:hypothetical protein n=1 Tax=Priestia megaterium TaxID=1404 RepID=UPI000C9C6EB7|nr:hypothetical protein [Priestia megaterium]PNE08457.1 hypothetical protein C1Y47_06625 [Priestia megaterium]